MNKIKSQFFSFLLAALLCVISYSVSIGMQDTLSKSIFDVMSYQDVLTVEIETDYIDIIEHKRKANTYEGLLSFTDAEGHELEFDVNIEVRGRFRRMFSQGIPPLKIDFKKKSLRNLGLAEYDDLKLVTMFHENKARAFQTMMKEYMTYQAFNILSPDSYRVQLLELIFINNESNTTTKEYGFIIEDTDQLAERIKAKEIDDLLTTQNAVFDTQQVEKVALFQYMIGNGDWNAYNGKNVKLFWRNDRVIVVPYDFDFSGLVNASYAVPNNQHGRLTVKDRIYLGTYENVGELSGLMEEFVRKKSDIISIFQNNRYLTKEIRKESIDYIESFFEEIDFRKKHKTPLKETVLQNQLLK